MQPILSLADAAILLQAFHVAFLALHDWVPLAPLNDIAAQQRFKPLQIRLVGTLISTAPFLFGLSASLAHRTTLSHWLVVYLIAAYAFLFIGEIEAWWATYFFGYRDARAATYRDLYASTHAFLPARHGIVPNTLPRYPAHRVVSTLRLCRARDLPRPCGLLGTTAVVPRGDLGSWKDHDVKRLDGLTATNVQFINIFGIHLATKIEALKNWSGEGYDVKTVALTDAAATMLSPNVGILTFNASADGTCFGQRSGRFGARRSASRTAIRGGGALASICRHIWREAKGPDSICSPRRSSFAGIVDLLKMGKHRRGEPVYLIELEYVGPANMRRSR